MTAKTNRGLPGGIFARITAETQEAEEATVAAVGTDTDKAELEPSDLLPEGSPAVPEFAQEADETGGEEAEARPRRGRPRKRPQIDDSGLSEFIDELRDEHEPQVVRNHKQRLGLYLDIALMEDVRDIVAAERTNLTAYTSVALKMLNTKMQERRGGPYPKRKK